MRPSNTYTYGSCSVTIQPMLQRAGNRRVGYSLDCLGEVPEYYIVILVVIGSLIG